MHIPVRDFHSRGRGSQVVTRCPSCGHQGTFDRVGVEDLHVIPYRLGQRRCPNPQCHGHIFFVFHDNDLVRTYPALRIDFSKEKIPAGILATFEEALICHAEECYVASAIMIRRTLEEICRDREASGKTLVDRIKALRSKVVLPEELFAAMNEIRLLGNDAAHVESRDYENVGRAEIEAAIEVTKEILKATYQLSDLVARLRALKAKPAT